MSKEWQFPAEEHVDPRTDAEVARDEAEAAAKAKPKKAPAKKS